MAKHKIKVEVGPAINVGSLLIEKEILTSKIINQGNGIWIFDGDVEDSGDIGFYWIHISVNGQPGNGCDLKVFVDDEDKTSKLNTKSKNINRNGYQYFDEEFRI